MTKAGFLSTTSMALMTLFGCVGYRTPLLDSEKTESAIPIMGKDAGGDATPDLRRADGRLSDTRPPFVTSSLGGCTSGSPYVLVLGEDEILYRFDPAALSLTAIAEVSCGGAGNSVLNSMTVSPIGPAYISNETGSLCVVDMTTFAVRGTPFDPSLASYTGYGMALLPDNSPAGQTLFIAGDQGDSLSRIDLTTFALTTIGPITPAVSSPELTAGPNGELYGFSVGNFYPALLLTIDPQTAQAIDVSAVPAGPYDQAFAFALVDWEDDFYLFVGEANTQDADVFRYRKGDLQVTHLGTLQVGIIGAGVAMCPAS
ncbi:MAG: hypothetical protein WBP56_17370 [Polyangia bacterium]